MKKLILSLAVISASFIAQSQTNKPSAKTSTPFRFSIGVETAVPVGKFGDAYSFGIGGSAMGIYQVDTDLGLTLNAGFIHYLGKDYSFSVNSPIPGAPPSVTTVKDQSLTVIPIMAGIRYNFTPMFYGSAQLGAGIFTKDKDIANSKSSSTFAYAPGIGYKFTDNFDAELKYQGYSKNSITNSSIGLRLAYTF